MDTIYTLKLNFTTETAKTATLTITNADNLATNLQVSDAMQAIIDSNTVKTTNGSLVSKKDAELISTEIIEFSVI